MTGNNKYGIFPLARLAAGELHDLRTPLFLFAMVDGKISTLLRATTNTPMETEYRELADRYDKDSIIEVLKEGSFDLPTDLHTLWNQYQEEIESMERMDREKEAIRQKAISYLVTNDIPLSRVCKELDIDISNTSKWLRPGSSTYISLEKARMIEEYFIDVRMKN